MREEINTRNPSRLLVNKDLTLKVKEAFKQKFDLTSISIQKENIDTFKEMIKKTGACLFNALKECFKENDVNQKNSIEEYLKNPEILHDSIFMPKIVKFFFKDEVESFWEKISNEWVIYQYTRAMLLMMWYRYSKGTLPTNEDKLQNEKRDIEYLPYIYYADGFASKDNTLLPAFRAKIRSKKRILWYSQPYG